MIRVLVIGLALGFVIVLAGVATCWGLEKLLASCTDHDRRLWEGGAVALVINGGLALESIVFRHGATKKKGKDLS